MTYNPNNLTRARRETLTRPKFKFFITASRKLRVHVTPPPSAPPESRDPYEITLAGRNWRDTIKGLRYRKAILREAEAILDSLTQQLEVARKPQR